MPFILVFMTALLVVAQAAAAAFESTQEASLGFTDNAYLESQSRRADLFLRLATGNTYSTGRHRLGLRLSYTDFIKENPNDVIGWELSDTYALSESDWRLWGAVSGHDFQSEGPATTDTSFDSFGLDFQGSREWEQSRDAVIVLETGYRMRRYPTFDSRTDHGFFATVSYDREETERFSWGTRSEIAAVPSTLSEYSRSHLELGASAGYSVNDVWSFSGDADLRLTRFSNRTVSTPVATGRGRGSALSSRSESETYSTVSFASEAVRRWNDVARTGVGLSFTSQSSRSGLQDYAATEILARAILAF